MALKDQLLGLGSSVFNTLGGPGALSSLTGIAPNIFSGALQLGGGLLGGNVGGIAGGLSSLGGMLMPAIATGALGGPLFFGKLFGGMTEAQNRMDEVKDVMTARNRFQDIAHDPQGWLTGQTKLDDPNISPPDQLTGWQDISRASLGGKLTVPDFQHMMLGEFDTPEMREALTGVMFGGAQQNASGSWANPEAAGFPWGHTGDTGAMGESGHAQVTIPGWPAGMINPLEVDLGGQESPGRGGPVGTLGPFARQLYAQIHNPNYSLGLSTGGPAGLLADFRRIGPDVRDEGE